MLSGGWNPLNNVYPLCLVGFFRLRRRGAMSSVPQDEAVSAELARRNLMLKTEV